MRTLVTGASGLLGAHVMTALGRTHLVTGVDRHAWWGRQPVQMVLGDLLSETFVKETVARTAPDLIVHCAAMVDVDACERQPALAEAYNAGVTRTLARAADRDCLFVYVTTDGVFQGDKPFSTESDEPRPRTRYGWSKLHGEEEVSAAAADHLIVRTNFYGWSSGRKKTSAEWLYRALTAGEPITGFADFYFTPIYVVDFVDRLLQLISSPHRGVFHVCGSERVSKYDFAVQLAREAAVSPANILKGSIDDAGLLAPRPKDMSLSTERFCRALSTTVSDCGAGIRRFLNHRGVSLADRFTDVARIADGLTP